MKSGLKRSYYKDIELFKNKTVLVWFILFLVFLAVLPVLVSRTHFMGFSIYLLNLIIIHCIVAIGLNILVGYTGQISLGHAGFFAIGAFTTLIFITKLSFPFCTALPLEELAEGNEQIPRDREVILYCS